MEYSGLGEKRTPTFDWRRPRKGWRCQVGVRRKLISGYEVRIEGI